ncbi:HAD-superfamily hydrolase subfamily IIA protein [Dioscorea alata]|uniref:HAD-superfamily hydrolase subfamily IIA protein n=2 Tax=Dioscorea alata TaxID=55571 RepID=A0ACB7VS71_DIOAL|nr:HAD-superfamily hydrolase subfamily IIA protein [Dioscorea alata]
MCNSISKDLRHDIALSSIVHQWSFGTMATNGAPSSPSFEALSSRTARSLIDSVDAFLFDCDGVIWTGYKLIDGVPEVLKTLRSLGQFRGRPEIAPDQREKFRQKLQQVQQQGHSNLLGAPILPGASHKQFTAEQQNSLLQQIRSKCGG